MLEIKFNRGRGYQYSIARSLQAIHEFIQANDPELVRPPLHLSPAGAGPQDTVQYAVSEKKKPKKPSKKNQELWLQVFNDVTSDNFDILSEGCKNATLYGLSFSIFKESLLPKIPDYTIPLRLVRESKPEATDQQVEPSGATPTSPTASTREGSAVTLVPGEQTSTTEPAVSSVDDLNLRARSESEVQNLLGSEEPEVRRGNNASPASTVFLPSPRLGKLYI